MVAEGETCTTDGDMVVEVVTLPPARTLLTTTGTEVMEGEAEAEGLTDDGLGTGRGLEWGGRQPQGSWCRLLPDPHTFRPHRERTDLHLMVSPPSQRGCQVSHSVSSEKRTY